MEKIKKTVRKGRLDEIDSAKEDLEYWLSHPPEERLAAVEFLRRQWYGSTASSGKLFELLNAHDVDYIVVGAYALAFLGSPRMTGDMDVFVKPSQENARKIIAALAAFGFGSLNLTEQDFQFPDQVIQLGVPPLRIDLITSISGVFWDEAFNGAKSEYYDDVPIRILGREQFIANKRAVGRNRDLADLEALGEK